METSEEVVVPWVMVRVPMQLSTAPFAALALILTVIAVSSNVSKGLALRVASIEPCGADDRRVIVVQALANGRVKIGAEDLNLSKLGDRLSVILRARAEKLVFVTADRDRPLEEVVQLIDIASYHAEHIALLPPLNVLRQPERPICPKVIFKNWQVDAYRSDTHLPNWH